MSDLVILPPNATPLEQALDANGNRLTDIDPDIIRRAMNPLESPLEFLPFLAWERGVDLWFDDWPEWKKRRITDQSYPLKGMKGTLSGVSAYLSYVDATVVDYVLPPQGIVARAQSADRIAQFRARFAQLRVYPYASRGNRAGAAAKSASATLTVVGGLVARAGVAAQHYGRRAVIRDNGEEKEIRSQDQLRIDTDETSIAATTFAIPATARHTEAIVGRAVVGSATAHATAMARMFVLGADGQNAPGAAVPPGGSSAQVLDIEPEQVLERHDGLSFTPVASRRPRMAVGRVVARVTRASRFIYDRWYLFDEDRAGFDPYQTIGPVVGRAVAGLSPYRAHLRINARFNAYGRFAVVGRTSPGKIVAGKASDRIDRVGLAINRSKALRDTVRFSTRTYRPREIGDLDFDQTHEFGGMVPITRRQA